MASEKEASEESALEETALEETVVGLLKKKKMTLSLAESCTGGAVAADIVNVPGASEVFMCGYVTYTNRAKRKCLGVKKSTLKKEGAVSAKCAGQMAKGGAKAAKTDVCLSVTGKTTVREFHFEGDRKSIRDQAVDQALTFICDRLRKYDR